MEIRTTIEYSSHGDAGEDRTGTVMVADRTREAQLSGMRQGAYENVDYGKG